MDLCRNSHLDNSQTNELHVVCGLRIPVDPPHSQPAPPTLLSPSVTCDTGNAIYRRGGTRTDVGLKKMRDFFQVRMRVQAEFDLAHRAHFNL